MNFECSHCGKQMAVEVENLGKQVCCPHCQQIVLAPPPAQVSTAFTSEPLTFAVSGALLDTNNPLPFPVSEGQSIVADSLSSRTAGRKQTAVSKGVSIWFVIPLASYSILATLLLIVLWYRLQSAEVHPLIAFLPDAEGDAPGVIRKPKGINEEGKRKLISQPLPEQMKIRPGETLNIGALAVTPQRIAVEQIGIARGLTRPEKLKELSLVLHLKLENLSEDESFQPLDRYFDRCWHKGSQGPPPLTLLEIGPNQRFYGGPAVWQPRARSPRDWRDPPEYTYLMEGDKPVIDPIDQLLDPGQTTEVFVCTDGDDPQAAELIHYKGEFLWRIHLRRGLVRVQDQNVPAAAVIGVTFTDRDIAYPALAFADKHKYE